MPYVTDDVRMALDEAGRKPRSAGELNYVLTRQCVDYIKQTGVSYSVLNEVIGALECAKQELYRRVAGPYEDGKKLMNGDVYGGLL